MPILFVVNNPDNWPLDVPGVQVVSARAYLAEPQYSEMRGVLVFNLCRSYGYQRLGYYVSMLAEARGHRPKPSIATIADMRMPSLVRIASDDLDGLIQHALAPLHSSTFVLSIYFGRPLAERYRRLARELFNQFQAPLLRARFSKEADRWQLTGIAPIPVNEVPDSHRPDVVTFAQDYFAGSRFTPRRQPLPRYELAILYDPTEDVPRPSNRRAIQNFIRAAVRLGMATEVITRDDYGRLAEFDALFIRQTTAVNHYTYRFARRAEKNGLVVVDDPRSIVRCANKVYLAELLARHEVPTPRTLIVHRDNRDLVAEELGLPCVLKQPDSSFSRGVVKIDDERSLKVELDRLLDLSEMVIAQEFINTDFDWRVGVFGGKPLYACRYHMVPRHWQILHRKENGEVDYGRVDTLLVEEAPRRVVRAAVRAASLFGDGFYGVDLKTRGRSCYVIEVNDNPNIDAGYEDRVLRRVLYDRIMATFLERIELRKRGGKAG